MLFRPHVLVRKPYVMLESHHIMKKRRHIMKKRHHVMEKVHHVMAKRHLVMEKRNDVMKKRHHVTEKPHHVIKKRHDVIMLCHLRQLRRSIINTKKITCILGDSIIKGINGYKMTKSLDYNQNKRVILKSFPGATTEDMYEYVKPTMKKKPDNIILHVGTNDLSRNVAPEVIANDIINLATSLIHSNMNVSVSGLTPRNDDQGIRCDELNNHLYKGCAERNIAFINHYQQMDRNRHLNRSKLHLNQYGSVTLANSFLNFISKD